MSGQLMDTEKPRPAPSMAELMAAMHGPKPEGRTRDLLPKDGWRKGKCTYCGKGPTVEHEIATEDGPRKVRLPFAVQKLSRHIRACGGCYVQLRLRSSDRPLKPKERTR